MSLLFASERREVIVFFIDMDRSMRKTDLAFPPSTQSAFASYSPRSSFLRDRFEVLRQALKCFIMQKSSTLANPSNTLWFSICGVWDDILELLPVTSASSSDVDLAVDTYLSKNLQLEHTHTIPISTAGICSFLEDVTDRFMATNTSQGRFTIVRGILFCSREVPIAVELHANSRYQISDTKIFLDVIPLRDEIMLAGPLGQAAGVPASQMTRESEEEDVKVTFVDVDEQTGTDPESQTEGEWAVLRRHCAARNVSCAVTDAAALLPDIGQPSGPTRGVAVGCSLMSILSIYHHLRRATPITRLVLPAAPGTPPPSRLSPRDSPRLHSPSSLQSHRDPAASATSPSSSSLPSPSFIRPAHDSYRGVAPPPSQPAASASAPLDRPSVLGRAVPSVGDAVIGIVVPAEGGARPQVGSVAAEELASPHVVVSGVVLSPSAVSRRDADDEVQSPPAVESTQINRAQ
jgi:hypothetical protein